MLRVKKIVALLIAVMSFSKEEAFAGPRGRYFYDDHGGMYVKVRPCRRMRMHPAGVCFPRPMCRRCAMVIPPHPAMRLVVRPAFHRPFHRHMRVALRPVGHGHVFHGPAFRGPRMIHRVRRHSL